jgi:hypothetical protein
MTDEARDKVLGCAVAFMNGRERIFSLKWIEFKRI